METIPLNVNGLDLQDPLIIAELACGHEGDVEKFVSLLNGVKKSGVNVVKSQIFKVEERVLRNHPEWSIFSKLYFSDEEWRIIATEIKIREMRLFSDVFGYESLQLAVDLDVDGLKIHSEDSLNYEFIAAAARTGKMTLIGVGASHRREIYDLLKFLQKEGLNEKIVLMPGVQTFPTKSNDHSLSEISDLKRKYQEEFGIKIGCADHISGDDPSAKIFPLLALHAGASVIEKHFTLNRSLAWEDYESALDQNNFMLFVESVSEVKQWMAPIKSFSTSENLYRAQFKKTASCNVDLKTGDRLSSSNVSFVKDKDIKIPLSSNEIFGKVVNQNIKKGSFIRRLHFKNKIGAAIIARNSSSRLPGKALADINGKPALQWLIDRIKMCTKLDDVILATSTSSSDDSLAELADNCGISCHRGDLVNVGSRLLGCANEFGLDHVVRVTGDDLLRDEKSIDQIIDDHLYFSRDVTISSHMPYGGQSEIFSKAVISCICEKVLKPSDTEYLEWFLQNDRLFSISYTKCTYVYPEEARLTLDYEEDLAFFKSLFASMAPNNEKFLVSDAMAWLLKNDHITKINSFKTPRYNLKRSREGVFEPDAFIPAINI